MRTNSMLLILVLIVMFQGAPGPAASSAPAASPSSAAGLVGAWNGEWIAPSGDRRGSVELVLAGVPGREGVVGQFTFVTGGLSRTLRYEGRLEDGMLRFPLVGDGQLVLQPRDAAGPGAAAALHGGWTDTRGALPAPQGRLRLSRSPVR
jgi:hypothetical protein